MKDEGGGMRRADREVTEFADIVDILSRCDTVCVAFADEDAPYALPFNFGYEASEGALTLYFHGAKEGRKYALMEKRPVAAFAASCSHRFVPGAVGCASTFLYESVCGRGDIEFLEGDEAARALGVIMRHYDGEREHAFERKHAAAVRVWKLTARELTGKRREKK